MEAFRHQRPDLDDASVLEAFASELHGSLVLPGSPDYEEARLVHNANSRPPSRGHRPGGGCLRRRADRPLRQ